MNKSRRRAPKAPTVHRVPGVHPAPALRVMPTIDRFDRLPGGLPPEPNRTPWKRMADTGKVAREPFASKSVKGEFWATKKYLEA